MKLKVLDTKREMNATCYLCKVDLIDYIKSLPKTYREFSIQRSIVKNTFLDALAKTIKEQKHIPPIVLIADQDITQDNEGFIELNKYEILDGLQRTHRLKIIWDTIHFITSKKLEETNNLMILYKKYKEKFNQIGCDIKLLRSLERLGCLSLLRAEDFFVGNSIWLEVWQGLNEAQQIEKMLVLNAGHKSVNIKHQLELLFLGTLLNLQEHAPEGVKFYREKEKSSIQYSKSRVKGEFHFSHIISSLIALSAGKVINTNADFVSELITEEETQIELLDGFNVQFIEVFLKFLYKLDQNLSSTYGSLGEKWLGREVVLIGIFAAIGEYAYSRNNDLIQELQKLEEKIGNLVELLKLETFEKARNDVELNKVNVGKVNKKAVYSAVHDLLRGEKFKGWNFYFGGEE